MRKRVNFAEKSKSIFVKQSMIKDRAPPRALFYSAFPNPKSFPIEIAEDVEVALSNYHTLDSLHFLGIDFPSLLNKEQLQKLAAAPQLSQLVIESGGHGMSKPMTNQLLGCTLQILGKVNKSNLSKLVIYLPGLKLDDCRLLSQVLQQIEEFQNLKELMLNFNRAKGIQIQVYEQMARLSQLQIERFVLEIAKYDNQYVANIVRVMKPLTLLKTPMTEAEINMAGWGFGVKDAGNMRDECINLSRVFFMKSDSDIVIKLDFRDWGDDFKVKELKQNCLNHELNVSRRMSMKHSLRKGKSVIDGQPTRVRRNGLQLVC